MVQIYEKTCLTATFGACNTTHQKEKNMASVLHDLYSANITYRSLLCMQNDFLNLFECFGRLKELYSSNEMQCKC